MPLVGLVDPSYDEREEDEPGRLPRWMTLHEVLEASATADPSWSPWPYEMLNGAISEWQERDYISTSLLTGGCSRGKVIERLEDIILTVDEMYASLRGTLVHRALQFASRPNSLAEARFFTTVKLPGLRESIEVSCSPDIITWNPNSLGDYKVTESPPSRYPWKGHTNQVTWNQYIVRHAERWTMNDQPFDLPFDNRAWVPEHLYLVYLGPKRPETMEVMKTIDVKTPTNRTVRRRMPYIAPDKDIEAALFPRIKAMSQALASYPEWPWDEEVPGFEGPPGWACPGSPWCKLPNCTAKRWPNGLWWKNP
jgi:hypothetical protein